MVLEWVWSQSGRGLVCVYMHVYMNLDFKGKQGNERVRMHMCVYMYVRACVYIYV